MVKGGKSWRRGILKWGRQWRNAKRTRINLNRIGITEMRSTTCETKSRTGASRFSSAKSDRTTRFDQNWIKSKNWWHFLLEAVGCIKIGRDRYDLLKDRVRFEWRHYESSPSECKTERESVHSRSDFLEMTLEEFLPAMKDPRNTSQSKWHHFDVIITSQQKKSIWLFLVTKFDNMLTSRKHPIY